MSCLWFIRGRPAGLVLIHLIGDVFTPTGLKDYVDREPFDVKYFQEKVSFPWSSFAVHQTNKEVQDACDFGQLSYQPGQSVRYDKLPGTVQPQYIRCGKPNCKCARGQLHGPFYYRIWRDHRGRQHKEYVRKADLEAVRNACDGRREDLKRIRGALARSERAVTWLMTGTLRMSAKMAEDEQFAHCCETIDHLLDCATGEIGTLSLIIKAIQALSPLIVAGQQGWGSTHRLTDGY